MRHDLFRKLARTIVLTAGARSRLVTLQRAAVSAVVCAALTAPSAAQAPQNRPGLPNQSIRQSPPPAKAELAVRLRQLRSRYDAIKAANVRLPQPRPNDPASMSQNRLQLTATMSDADKLMLQLDNEKKKLDSMSEMGEMESLRLQMAMDRMSKMMSTLSNLIKKMDQTSDSIIQNLK